MIIVGVSFNVSMASSSQAGNRHPQTFHKQAVPFVNLVKKVSYCLQDSHSNMYAQIEKKLEEYQNPKEVLCLYVLMNEFCHANILINS